MSSAGAIDDPVAEVLDQWSAALDAFSDIPWAQLTAARQVEVADRYEELLRRTEFLGIQITRELEVSDAAKVAGAPSVSALLKGRMRLSGAEASARVRAAKALCESRSITNAVIPAPLPQVAEAAAAGVIGAEHVDKLLRAMSDLPDEIEPGVRDSVERFIVDYARQADPVETGRFGHALVLSLCPQNPDPEKNNAKRGLVFHDDLPGLVNIRGRCTAEAAAIIQSALDPLAKPRPEVDGIKDLRTHPQRQIDALEELAGQALRQGDLPSQGGERPHVTVGLTPEGAQAGVAYLPWVGPVALNTADWMFCDATITFIERDENGVPIRISKPQRTIPAWQRRSVFDRDKGCTFPGCDKPTGWSDIHHVRLWEENKEHQVDNLVTLCSFHHKLVHQQKWQIDFIGRIPYFRPPRWIDTDQIPRRNRLHHVQRNQPLRT